MVDDVVVGPPNAAPVSIVLFELLQSLLRGWIGNVLKRGPDVGLPSIRIVEVVLAGGVETIGLDGAVDEAPGSGASRRLLRPELQVAAKAGDRYRRNAALEPHDQIEIVAAFRHQHRGAGLGLVPPLAPDERYRHVVIADVLIRLDVDYVSDDAFGHLLLDRSVEGSVAKHMADHEPSIAAPARGK